MRRIVIFGGAFDPIHNGHINMAINASKALNAEVFFVPARVSVWKDGSESSPEDRVKMIKLAIKDANKEDILKVSNCEINSKKEKNYSIDTVKFFKENYPDAEIYFLLGTDHVNLFDKWKDCDLMAEIAHIVYFSRPGYINDENMIKRFKMTRIDGDLLDISSTDVREMKSLDISPSVLDYIIDKRLYFIKKVKSYLSEKRFLHSVSVARLAYEIAIDNKIQEKDKYMIAGLLHDIGKEVPINKQKEIVEEFYSDYIDMPLPIIHQFVGEYLAKKDFEVVDKDILNAIKFHTTGRREMSLLEKCIYASDKIEPTRGFDSSDLILSMKVNINDGFITVLTANKEYFILKNIPYDNDLTKECIEYYLK